MAKNLFGDKKCKASEAAGEEGGENKKQKKLLFSEHPPVCATSDQGSGARPNNLFMPKGTYMGRPE